MGIDYTLGAVSGPDTSDCTFLAYRGPAGRGFSPDAGDSWVIGVAGDQWRARMSSQGWLTHVWRSPTGRVWVTAAHGVVHATRPGDGESWVAHTIGGMPVGVWGLDDTHVYVWGLRGGAGFLKRWDGSSWEDLAAPARRIAAMDGFAPDQLYAVGDKGLLARWDGTSWEELPGARSEPLAGLHAASPDEVWACGGGGGLYRGSADGFSRVLTAPSALTSVASWKGRVWVAALGDLGLCTLDGEALASVKPNLRGLHLHPGEILIFQNVGFLGRTLDGQVFTARRPSTFAKIVEGIAPTW